MVFSRIQSAYDEPMTGDPGPLVALMADDLEWHSVLRRAPD
jgi:hypothetical protein